MEPGGEVGSGQPHCLSFDVNQLYMRVGLCVRMHVCVWNADNVCAAHALRLFTINLSRIRRL